MCPAPRAPALVVPTTTRSPTWWSTTSSGCADQAWASSVGSTRGELPGVQLDAAWRRPVLVSPGEEALRVGESDLAVAPAPDDPRPIRVVLGSGVAELGQGRTYVP